MVWYGGKDLSGDVYVEKHPSQCVSSIRLIHSVKTTCLLLSWMSVFILFLWLYNSYCNLDCVFTCSNSVRYLICHNHGKTFPVPSCAYCHYSICSLIVHGKYRWLLYALPCVHENNFQEYEQIATHLT